MGIERKFSETKAKQKIWVLRKFWETKGKQARGKTLMHCCTLPHACISPAKMAKHPAPCCKPCTPTSYTYWSPKSPVKRANHSSACFASFFGKTCMTCRPHEYFVTIHGDMGPCTRKKKTPLGKSYKIDLFRELVSKTNPFRSFCRQITSNFTLWQLLEKLLGAKGCLIMVCSLKFRFLFIFPPLSMYKSIFYFLNVYPTLES